MKEEWRVIEDFPDYAVSNMGRVKRVRTSKTGRKPGNYLSATPGKIGYPQVDLYGHAGKARKYIHFLVLEAFIGFRPSAHTANHKDGNKSNNLLSNLEWVTQSENVKHSYVHNLRQPPAMKGEKNPNSKLKDSEAWLIKKLLASGKVKQKTIAKMFRVTPETVSYINCGLRYKHVEFDGFTPNARPKLKAIGERIYTSKLNVKEVWLIKKLLKHHVPYSMLGRMFRVNKSTITGIATGKRWKHVSYP